MCRIARISLFIAALTLPLAPRLVQSGGCCAHCGCSAHLCKMCRVVPETKEKIEICWDVKCEDFCVPGPSKKCGVVEECDECGSWCRTIWQPGCAHVRTKKAPVKKEVKRKVQTFKWEVVTVCDHCRRHCSSLHELSATQKLAAAMESAITGEEPSTVPPPVGAGVVQATAASSSATFRR